MSAQGNNSQKPHEFALTADQLSYLAVKLPKSFSFVTLSKPKQLKDNPKTKNSKSFEEEEDMPSTTKTIKESLDKINPEFKRQRTTKSSISQKQDKIIPRSVYVFEQAIPSEMKPCMKLLQQLKKHPSSWPFLEPVDPVKLDIPAYFTIVKQPIDLGTIGNNLRTRYYETPTQLHADISKMFTNSYKFNAKGSEVYLMTKQLQEYYNKQVSQPDSINNCLQNSSNPYQIQHSTFKKQPLKRQYPSQHEETKINKKKKAPEPSFSLSIAEKKQLGQNIRKLPRDCLKGVWEIVSNGNSTMQELKFDIDQLTIEKARQLEAYVNNQLSKNLGPQMIPKECTYQTAETMRNDTFSDDASSFMSEESIYD